MPLEDDEQADDDDERDKAIGIERVASPLLPDLNDPDYFLTDLAAGGSDSEGDDEFMNGTEAAAAAAPATHHGLDRTPDVELQGVSQKHFAIRRQILKFTVS
jgi:hypothetical protein